MSLVWLSHIIDENIPLYGGLPNRIKLTKDKDMTKGDSCNTMLISLPNHAGTHIDAPRHFFNEGYSVDQYSPYSWVFKKIKIIDLPNIAKGSSIGVNDVNVEAIKKEIDCLLLRTSFTRFRKKRIYWENSPYLSLDLAKALKKMTNINIIGMDFMSVSNLNNRREGRLVHREFLRSSKKKAAIRIIEDMNLSTIRGKINKIFVIPLRIKGADGVPCTVLAEIGG